jgi:hypothetical protein
MNLYAIIPSYAPGNEVQLMLAKTDQEAMQHGVYVAAHDLTRPDYASPSAEVYRIGPAELIGEAKATDAPAEWEWARGVHALLAQQDQFDAQLRQEHGER